MLNEYFAHVTEELLRKSERMRADFASHKPSAGHNREAIVGDFLCENLPKANGISTGLVLSQEGELSNQADLVIVDHLSNAPLYSTSPNAIWLVESVYCLIEVKTSLSPSTLNDALAKCRRFKRLKREWADTFGRQKIFQSLFVLWSFEAPSPQLVKSHVVSAFTGLPRDEQPDFIVVPGSLIVNSGQYYELVKVGQPGSNYASFVSQSNAGQVDPVLGEGLAVLEIGDNTLLAWLTWLISWLAAAGPRRAPLNSYVPADYIWGKSI